MAAVACPEFKVILCGEYGVGKTSIFRRFLNNTFLDTSRMTKTETRQTNLGLDQYSKKFAVNGSGSSFKELKIQLWDTGGLERVASITNSYYKFSEAALLVFSLTSMESFHALSHYLLEVLSQAENAKIFLVGNKCELDKSIEVTDDDIDMFMEQFPKFQGYFRISAKTGEGVEEMFDDIKEKLALSYNSYSHKLSQGFKLHSTYDDDDNYDDPSDPRPTSAGCCS